MSDIPQIFDYSVTCAICGTIYKGKAENPFQFMATARDAGWDVQDAIHNKPVKCPTHKL